MTIPPGPVGSYVSLAVNGLHALDAPGCLTRVQAAGFPVARHRLWSGSGKLLGDVARYRRPEDPLHSVTLMRADLVSALGAAALKSGARIVTGQRLDAASDPRAADADPIVGADGIWSATRRTLDPAAPQPDRRPDRHPDAGNDHAAHIQPLLREGGRLALRLRPGNPPGCPQRLIHRTLSRA